MLARVATVYANDMVCFSVDVQTLYTSLVRMYFVWFSSLETWSVFMTVRKDLGRYYVTHRFITYSITIGKLSIILLTPCILLLFQSLANSLLLSLSHLHTSHISYLFLSACRSALPSVFPVHILHLSILLFRTTLLFLSLCSHLFLPSLRLPFFFSSPLLSGVV